MEVGVIVGVRVGVTEVKGNVSIGVLVGLMAIQVMAVGEAEQ